MTKTMIADSRASRELAELNALHLERALIEARLDAAAERLLASDVPTMIVNGIDGEANVLPGSRVHVLLETWRPPNSKRTHSAHVVEACNGHWCHVDRKPRSAPRERGFTFAFRGTWTVATYRGHVAILVDEEAAA